MRAFFRDRSGAMYVGDSSEVLSNNAFTARHRGKCQLVLTSPPYELITKKAYGNHRAQAYVDWLSSFAAPLRDLLTPTGSIVIELGNSWESGKPTMSTTPIEALLAFKRAANLELCQEFIWYNPTRLPSPAQWVNIERSRLKDAYTRIWWLAATDRPKANNKNVLKAYSNSMKSLLDRKRYNAGVRPSEHRIGATSFFSNNGGAIRPSVPNGDEVPSLLRISNTTPDAEYREYCRAQKLPMHPARMPPALADLFISFLTDPGDLVLDPFAGSNTTGAVAKALGRRWVSIEKSEKYAAGSLARFAQRSPTRSSSHD